MLLFTSAAGAQSTDAAATTANADLALPNTNDPDIVVAQDRGAKTAGAARSAQTLPFHARAGMQGNRTMSQSFTITSGSGDTFEINTGDRGNITVRRNGTAVPAEQQKLTADSIEILSNDGTVVLKLSGIAGLGGRAAVAARTEPRAQLGVTTGAPDEALAAQLGIDTTKTSVIQSITSNSAAEKAGFKRFDIITQIEGSDHADPDSIRAVIAKKKPGESLHATVLRKGGGVDVVATLTIAPDFETVEGLTNWPLHAAIGADAWRTTDLTAVKRNTDLLIKELDAKARDEAVAARMKALGYVGATGEQQKVEIEHQEARKRKLTDMETEEDVKKLEHMTEDARKRFLVMPNGATAASVAGIEKLETLITQLSDRLAKMEAELAAIRKMSGDNAARANR